MGSGSYPIETGLVLGDGRTFCRLIRPLPQWEHWDPAAERMHGIRRELLHRRGIPPEDMAEELNRRLGRQSVYSDGWANDFA